MSKMKKVLIMCTACVLVAVLAIGGTFAYLTDRDSEVNTFTVGDVEIGLEEVFDAENANLIPGKEIQKEAKITNTGDNDAWVWMTMAIPAALDSVETDTGLDNPLHWNIPGVVWKGYGDNESWATEAKVQTALDKGFITEDHIDSETGLVKADCLWTICQNGVGVPVQTYTDAEGVVYNVYTFLYNGVLAAGETTPVALHQVKLDNRIDVNTDGEMYWVINGETTALGWNANDGAKIIVSAYAMQTEGFDSVEAAYNAYQTQWAENGTEYAE